jgi:hypothetical protein
VHLNNKRCTDQSHRPLLFHHVRKTSVCKGSAAPPAWGVVRVKPPFLLDLTWGLLPFRDVLVGEELLLGQSLVEFLQHLARVDQGFDPGAPDEMLFVALPADAVNEAIIQGSVFIGML